jgi:hypothetical protein
MLTGYLAKNPVVSFQLSSAWFIGVFAKMTERRQGCELVAEKQGKACSRSHGETQAEQKGRFFGGFWPNVKRGA